jgi:hypothetical protein
MWINLEIGDSIRNFKSERQSGEYTALQGIGSKEIDQLS